MSEFEEFEWKTTWVNFKETRYKVLCVMRLPEEVRDRTPREVVRKAHGGFILSFTCFPTVGETFPFEGQLWRIKQIVQFPHRYRTTGTRYPAIALLEWIGQYDSVTDIIANYLNFEDTI